MKDGWEIERKFLVRREALPPLAPGERIAQVYLGFDPTVRVRLQAGRGYLTVKGRGLAARRELELEIAAEAAGALMDFRVAGTIAVEKTRYRVRWGGRTWEVDVFEGPLEGLVLAEVELDSLDAALDTPPWADQEVTDDPSYQNANLAKAGNPP